VLKPGNQPPSIRVIADDLLAGVAPRHDMVDGALVFDPKLSWHGERLRGGTLECQARTKNKI
jgi:hypothetical protein